MKAGRKAWSAWRRIWQKLEQEKNKEAGQCARPAELLRQLVQQLLNLTTAAAIGVFTPRTCRRSQCLLQVFDRLRFFAALAQEFAVEKVLVDAGWIDIQCALQIFARLVIVAE